MSRNNCCRFDLLQQVVRVYVGKALLCRVIVRIKLAILVILDLDDCCDSLLTEGGLIPSGAARHNTRCQVKMVGSDDLAQRLSQNQ
jgi:hypothetical protein